MDLVSIAEVVSAVAVLFGFGYAIVEVRRHRQRRARESALALVNSYQTAEFAQAIWMLPGLPTGLSRKEIEELLGDDVRLVSLLMTTWESLGILVFRGEVRLSLVDDFFSGAIVLSWQKLRGLVLEMRETGDRETYFEWFQWLAERFADREAEMSPVPAHIQHSDWRERT